jgi:hypothetical protein
VLGPGETFDRFRIEATIADWALARVGGSVAVGPSRASSSWRPAARIAGTASAGGLENAVEEDARLLAPLPAKALQRLMKKRPRQRQ